MLKEFILALIIVLLSTLLITYNNDEFGFKDDFKKLNDDKALRIGIVKRFDDDYPKSNLTIGFIFENLVDIGGIEMWFLQTLTLFKYLGHEVYGIQIINAWDPYKYNNLKINPGLLEIQLHTDTQIYSCFDGVTPIFKQENGIRILHHDISKNPRHMRFNEIITVGPNEGFIHIPYQVSKVPSTGNVRLTNMIGMISRMSDEKNIRLYCDIKVKYKKVLISVSYGNTIDCDSVELWTQDMKKELLQQSTFMLNLSPSEGGPIVFLESVSENTPMIMFDTGYGKLLKNKLSTLDRHSVEKFINNANPKEFILEQRTIMNKINDIDIHQSWNSVLNHKRVDISKVRSTGSRLSKTGSSLYIECYDFCVTVFDCNCLVNIYSIYTGVSLEIITENKTTIMDNKILTVNVTISDKIVGRLSKFYIIDVMDH